MNGRADCCPTRTHAEWWRSEGQHVLDLCRHHTRKHRAMLEAAGWIEFTELTDDAPAVTITGGALLDD